MSEPSIEVNITEWIDSVNTDPIAHAQRQITEIILHAIAMTPFLAGRLYMKGGLLMGLGYGSARQTTDIDFSASSEYLPNSHTAAELCNHLNPALRRTAATLGYADFVLQVQSIKEQPHKRYPNAKFPALEVKIGYATRGTIQEERLKERQASNFVQLDISFKEKTSRVQTLELAEGTTLLAYSLNDMIAEKYRAVLEQSERNRYRRQDVYDLRILIEVPGLDPTEIVNSLFQKCEFREIVPTPHSILDSEIKRRSGSEWHTLELEISDLPDFEDCFKRVADFYLRLPWPTS